jgi:formylglycine-generating enzyme
MRHINILILLLTGIFSLTGTFTSQAKSSKKQKNMVLIHAKNQSFIMGMDQSELFDNEPVKGWANYVGKHKVLFTYDFFMDKNLVSQADYQELMNYNPSGNNTGDLNLPVEKISYYDAVLYCNARSKQEKLDPAYSYTSVERKENSISKLVDLTCDIKKNGYRLPTNAEYEYAERAKTTGKYFFLKDGKDVNVVGNKYAWSINQSGFTYEKGGIFTHPVGIQKANPWGIYDLIGNLFEWCEDWDAPYPTSNQIDPVGPDNGPEGMKVAKGGSYRTDIAYHMRIAYHYKWPPDNTGGEIGFRCVATKKNKK